MGGRSNKQHLASVNRIKLENKSIRQAQKLITKQYQMLGRKLPQKLANETATFKDMERYMRTIRNTLDRRINKDIEKKDIVLQKLNKLNRLNRQRKNAMTGLLSGYEDGLVDAYTQGKLIAIGKDITISMPSTNEVSRERIEKLAELNKVESVSDFLDMRIKAMNEDLKEIKSHKNRDYSFMADDIKNIFESHGYIMTEQNMLDLKRRMKNMDFISAVKFQKIMNVKLENRFYEIYKDSLDMNDNDRLIEEFRNDINKSSRTRINEHYRIIT